MHQRMAVLALLMSIFPLQSACAQADATASQPAAQAPTTPAGLVKRSTGQVTLLRAGQSEPAQPGLTVRMGDTLRTGPDSSVGITLSDDTLLTAGPNSELVITTYAFNPTNQEGSLLASLWRGTLSMVTGLIGKMAPEQVKVQTRTVVLGVRGTEFIVDAGEGIK